MTENVKKSRKALPFTILGLIIALIGGGTYYFGSEQSAPEPATAETSASETANPEEDSAKEGWIEYDRDAFLHWDIASIEYGFSGALDTCDVREAVLIRDAETTQIYDDATCDFDGYWISPYGKCMTLDEFEDKGVLLTEISDSEFANCEDGEYLWYPNSSNPRDYDIDHIVALEDACTSGACGPEWDEIQRTLFANDSENVLAVDLGENRSKGSKTLAEWMPHGDFACEYAERYISIKEKYELEIDDASQKAYEDMQDTCSRFITQIPNPVATPPAIEG